MGTIRAFIAFKLPEHVISSIGRVQEDIKKHGFKIRWVRPGNIHLTLKFLGDIQASERERISSVIAESVHGYSPIFLNSKGVGVFPNMKRARVVWVGIGGQIDRLIDLQKKLDANLERIGFKREKRLFKGHLTLGRIKGRVDMKKLMNTLKKYEEFETETFVAQKVIFYKSDLKPDGAVYTELNSVDIGSD